MADYRIVDVSTILSKWHDLLKARWPNFPCQTFTMFMHNNSQELVRCKDCIHRGWELECPMCFDEWGEEDIHTVDHTTDDGFCHCGEREKDHEAD